MKASSGPEPEIRSCTSASHSARTGGGRGETLVGSRTVSALVRDGRKEMDLGLQRERFRRRGSPILFSWGSQAWEYGHGSLSDPVPKDAWETPVGSCEAAGGVGSGRGGRALSTSPPALAGSGGVQGTPLSTPRGLQQELAEREAMATGMW